MIYSIFCGVCRFRKEFGLLLCLVLIVERNYTRSASGQAGQREATSQKANDNLKASSISVLSSEELATLSVEKLLQVAHQSIQEGVRLKEMNSLRSNEHGDTIGGKLIDQARRCYSAAKVKLDASKEINDNIALVKSQVISEQAWLEFNTSKDFQTAKDGMQEALKLDSKSGRILTMLAAMILRESPANKDFLSQADAYLDKAIALDPSLAEAYWIKSQIKGVSGDSKGAISALRLFLKCNDRGKLDMFIYLFDDEKIRGRIAAVRDLVATADTAK